MMRSYDMYEPYTYVTNVQIHEVPVTISGTMTVTDLLLSIYLTHRHTYKTNVYLVLIYVEQTFNVQCKM